MRVFFKIISIIGLFICSLIFSLIYFGDRIIPDNITIVENSGYDAPEVFGMSIYTAKSETESDVVSGTARASSDEARISILNVIPVKNSTVVNSKRKYVYLGGGIFGIKLYTKGVIIVGTDVIDTDGGVVSPAEKAGLKIGDIILSVNGQKIESVQSLTEIIQASSGRELEFSVSSDGENKQVVFATVKESSSGKYRAGLWVRDSTAGIGTVTFYNPENGSFGGLGHAIYDTDTQEIMPMLNGEMAEAYISGFYKSSNGSVGELCGVFTGKSLGTLCINGETGIYGFTDSCEQEKLIPVAVRQEAKTGKAQIYCTIDKNGPQYYDVEIIKIYSNSSSVNKDMVIEITDEDLLAETGGILQGMSGSPIIQNGMLVGAVTHVFVNNTKQGYAIFSERMLETSVSQEMQKYEQILKKAS